MAKAVHQALGNFRACAHALPQTQCTYTARAPFRLCNMPHACMLFRPAPASPGCPCAGRRAPPASARRAAAPGVTTGTRPARHGAAPQSCKARHRTRAACRHQHCLASRDHPDTAADAHGAQRATRSMLCGDVTAHAAPGLPNMGPVSLTRARGAGPPHPMHVRYIQGVVEQALGRQGQRHQLVPAMDCSQHDDRDIPPAGGRG